jgi:hypothetical protein
MPTEKEVRELVEGAGGTVGEIVGPLPDGSGFMTASFPLPKEHWLFSDRKEEPPKPAFSYLWGGTCSLAIGTVEKLKDDIRVAARFAIRAATRNGKEMDFDPDALVQNLVLALLGPEALQKAEPTP